MPNTSHTNIPALYAELLELFEQARQIQTESTQLLAVARKEARDVQAVPEADAAPGAPRSPEETLDCIVTLLAACSFENQVTIVKTLALGIASTARARANVKHPPTA